MSSGITGQETSLPIKSSFNTASDYVRMVIGGISSRVTPTVFATYVSSLIASSVQKLKVRHITSAGAILATDNVVTCTGTFAVTMPNPATVYDATDTISNSISIATKGSGTITINPYDAEVFYDGSSNASLSINSSTVTLVTDGTDWVVIGA